MANVIFDSLKEGLLTSDINLSADSLYVLLLQEYNASDDIITSASTLSATLSFEYSGTSATPLTETSGVNYTSGGYELSGVTVSAGSTPFLDADDITISASTITAGGALLYKKLTPIEVSIPLVYYDFGVNQVSENGTFTIQWNSEGLIELETG